MHDKGLAMKVAWVCAYPVKMLESAGLKFGRRVGHSHPYSWIVNLSNELARQKQIELHIITETKYIARSRQITFNNISFHILRNALPFTFRSFPAYLPVDAISGFFARRLNIIKKIKDINPDIVHAHGTEGPNALAAIGSGRKNIISIQGIVSEYHKICPSLHFALTGRYENLAVKKGRNFICKTDFDKRFVLSLNPEARIYNISEAMNPVFFQGKWVDPTENSILFVGAFEERKGLHLLLEALSRVAKSIPDVCLYVIGTGEKPRKLLLEKMCRKLGIMKHVKFLGFKTAPEIADWHLRSKIFVMPSKIENSPNALTEAMVSGMPIIASDRGGIGSLVEHNESGVLVNPDDASQMSQAIVNLLLDKDLRRNLGKNAKDFAQKHRPPLVAESTLKAYKEIIEEG